MIRGSHRRDRSLYHGYEAASIVSVRQHTYKRVETERVCRETPKHARAAKKCYCRVRQDIWLALH